MANQDAKYADQIHELRMGAIRLKKNLKDWDTRFDYKLTRYEGEVVLNLIDFLDKMDDVCDIIDMMKVWDRDFGEDEDNEQNVLAGDPERFGK